MASTHPSLVVIIFFLLGWGWGCSVYKTESGEHVYICTMLSGCKTFMEGIK
uniref:Uncharacterized protein n=1 Tax=Rhizophora mucronata TaxID=61149 RepID=A0A2P2QG44_RHIMU